MQGIYYSLHSDLCTRSPCEGFGLIASVIHDRRSAILAIILKSRYSQFRDYICILFIKRCIFCYAVHSLYRFCRCISGHTLQPLPLHTKILVKPKMWRNRRFLLAVAVLQSFNSKFTVSLALTVYALLHRGRFSHTLFYGSFKILLLICLSGLHILKRTAQSLIMIQTVCILSSPTAFYLMPFRLNFQRLFRSFILIYSFQL